MNVSRAVLLQRERRDQQRNPSKQHLERGGGEHVLPARMPAAAPARIRRSHRPSHARDLRRDHAAEKPAGAAIEANLRPHQHDDAAEADDETEHAPQRDRLPVRHQRVEADHPERRRRDQDRRQPARHGLLCPHDRAVAEPEQEDAKDGQRRPFAPGRQAFAAQR